jgi:hypothetical protein
VGGQLGFGIFGGQGKAECAPAFSGLFKPEPAVVCVNEVPAEMESQTGSLFVFGTRRGGIIPELEQGSGVLHPPTAVADENPGFRFIGFGGYDDFSIPGSELQRVGNEVPQYDLDHVRIGPGEGTLIYLEPKGNILVFRHMGQFEHHPVSQGMDIDAGGIALDALELAPGPLKEIVHHHKLLMTGVVQNGDELFLFLFAETCGIMLEHVQGPDDRIERAAQVMGDDGEQTFAEGDFIIQAAFRLLQFQMDLDPREKFLLMERFGDEIHPAGFKALQKTLGIGSGREENNRDLGTGVFLADAAAHFESVHFRHHYIQDDEIRKLVIDDSQGFRAALGETDIITLLGKNSSGQLNIPWFIVHQEYPEILPLPYPLSLKFGRHRFLPRRTDGTMQWSRSDP